MRLQKFLAGCGIKSRRGCVGLITAGRISVNGTTVFEPGLRINPDKDKVLFDGRKISPPLHNRTIVLYKPRGYVCARPGKRPEEDRTVYDLIANIRERLVPAGRLDKNSEGLLIMSGDGLLVLHITHPRYGKEKTYHATVSGEVTQHTLKQLSSRMVIDGYRILPARVSILRQIEGKKERHVLSFTLKEGRNRQIRKMCESAGLKIHRLVRVSIGNLRLTGLKPGEWRDLTESELQSLRERLTTSRQRGEPPLRPAGRPSPS